MKPTLRTLAVLVAGLAFATPGTTIANTVEGDTSTQQRIVLSGKLRVLSQAVPAAACHFYESADAAAAAAQLQNATIEYSAILDALEFGDPALGISGAEERRKTVAEIGAVRDMWTPLQLASEAMTAGDVSRENLQVLLTQNAQLLDASSSLAAHLAGEYANPAELVKADAFLLDIAGRQEMLVQRMLKASCMVATDIEIASAAEVLQESMMNFDAALTAMRDGMPAAGIRKPPTPQISDQLVLASQTWAGIKPTLEQIVAGQELTIESETDKFRALNGLMGEMDDILHMYEAAFQ